jgi:Glyoxalase/Bleomycin resistance protein/Dioxygenase superfamily
VEQQVRPDAEHAEHGSLDGAERRADHRRGLAEYPRIAALGVEWVMPPTTQPWGNRSMMFRDPAGNLVNVFCAAGCGACLDERF